MLSYTAWQKRFGGKQDVLGRALTLNGNPATIIGVLPAQFQFAPYSGDFWATLRGTDACEQHRDCHNLTVIARLKDGVSIEAGSADMRSIAQQLRRQYPETNRIFGSANLVPLREFILGDVRPVLLIVLSGAGLLLLLISCLGLAFANWGIKLLTSFVPDEKMQSMPYLRALGLNHWTVTFACVLALLAGVIFAR
jgi:hypothetical protein